MKSPAISWDERSNSNLVGSLEGSLLRNKSESPSLRGVRLTISLSYAFSGGT